MHNSAFLSACACLCLWLLCAVAAVPAGKATRDGNQNVLIRAGEDPDPEIRLRRDFIKRMMKDAWDDYVRHAWGDNELRPVSQTGYTGDIFGTAKLGSTIVDSLDTLYIMEMEAEYQQAREFVATNLTFSNVNANVSLFEVNIRFLGGLLSAYALSGDDLYKERAYELGLKLLPTFNTPTGIPYGHFHLGTGEPEDPNADSGLAEMGTLHLEFTYLSEITGDPVFKEKVDGVRRALRDAEKPRGLYWNFMSTVTGQFTEEHVSIGALGDSFYEYLLKAYIQLGDLEARQMYDEAMNGFFDNGLVRLSAQNSLAYIAEWNGTINPVVGHLACFAGGMLALGSHVDPRPVDHPNRTRDMQIGTDFTRTCHASYIRTQTGIGPEVFLFTDEIEAATNVTGQKGYVLRPEVLESYFILHRLTGDRTYRDWAWHAALAIERHCKAGPGRGYSGLQDVYSINPVQDDIQQSFFLAETLKYLYLIFSTDELISLEQWVFNTEAHPLPVKGQNPLY